VEFSFSIRLISDRSLANLPPIRHLRYAWSFCINRTNFPKQSAF